jgi:sRNA-binding protein
MATKFEEAAKRVNPTGKSSTEMTRELMDARARQAAEKQMQQDAAKEAAQKEMEMQSAPKPEDETIPSNMKKGGSVKKMAKGGSASSRADGIAQRGKTRGKYC